MLRSKTARVDDSSLSNIAPRPFKGQRIQVGFYPVLHKGSVSLIGRDMDSGQKGRLWLAELAQEVEREVGDWIWSEEEVAA
jgi:hypothetical protein